MLDIFTIFVADNRKTMQNDNNITLLEQQMANNEDICCSCGNIISFPQAFFDRFRKGLPIEHAAIESIPLETK